MQGRAYRLTSAWLLPASAERCWAVLADPTLSWPRWWPGVTATDVVPAPDGPVGSTATVVFRSPARYSLTLRLEVATADATRRIGLRSSGDLVGWADARLHRLDDTRTRLDVVWAVRPTRAWMALAGPVLAPAFAGAHRSVMRSGERGLVAYLTSSP